MKKGYQFENRQFVIGGIVCAIVILYIAQLFTLQITDSNYKISADRNAFLERVQYPSRGLIYDRNGDLMVYNQLAYDVMVIMREVQPFDTLDFCNTLSIDRTEFDRLVEYMKNRKYNPGYSPYTPQTFLSQLTVKDYGKLQEKLYLFPGFYIQNRMLRKYSYPVAANIVGNIREVSPNDIKRDSYYKQGDYTGDLGVERSYETTLRGSKGVEVLLRDAHGRIKGRYEEGKHDVAPIAGSDIKLSIDAELQLYGEQLMQNKVGAIVAIEPSTGEVLALVTAPSYDPSILVGRDRGKNYRALTTNRYKPLFDRSIMATYPPGSTFKPTQGLMFLQEGVVTESSVYPCNMGFYGGGLRVGCHAHSAPLNLVPALATSCNAYFCYAFREMIDNYNKKYKDRTEAMNTWRDYMVSMGYGYNLGLDLPGEKRGFIPNSDYYSKVYNGNYWRALTIISLSIGQGEVLATPLQIANLGATIANRGHYITPHVVKEVIDRPNDSILTPTNRHTTMVEPKYYDLIVEGMRQAVLGGTCRLADLPNIEVCGKTGTAQNPHGKDHSAFLGFAPKENPQIAICVYVQNAGWGASYGVPIGSLMIEKYLNDTIATNRKWMEERMFNSNTLIYSELAK